MLPKISLITPSYNQAQYLERTILSIIEQNYPNLEYIIMDGGSTDESIQIIQKYADKLSYWVSTKDNGQSDAIRCGFEKSTGDILAWVNSDDLLLPNSLAHVAEMFKCNPGKHFLAGGHIDIDKDNNTLWCHWPVLPSFEKLLLVGFYLGQPACFWSREIYNSVGGLDPSIQFIMDQDLFLRILKKNSSMVTNRLLACFRHHSMSKSATMEDVHQKELSNLKNFWGYSKLNEQDGIRVRLLWKLSTYIKRAPKLFKLWIRYKDIHPWLTYPMDPKEFTQQGF